MVYNLMWWGVYGLYPSSEEYDIKILQIKIHNVSEAGSASVLSWMEGRREERLEELVGWRELSSDGG
jgi:hypothetical protein